MTIDPKQEIAVMRYCKAFFDWWCKDKEVVPDGYEFGGATVNLQLPLKAGLTRAGGNEKDAKGDPVGKGFDEKDPSPLALPPMAELLYYQRLLENPDATKSRLAEKCIKDALKGEKTETPKELLSALERVRKKLPPGDKVLTKTPAESTGAKEITFTIDLVDVGKGKAA